MAEIEQINFTTEDDADETLLALRNMIANNGQISVADFLEVVGNASDSDDDDAVGWTNLDGVETVKFKHGWFLQMPDPVPIL